MAFFVEGHHGDAELDKRNEVQNIYIMVKVDYITLARGRDYHETGLSDLS